jgi:hypothetical protein
MGRTKEEIYLSILISGFFMPVLQSADSGITYALTQTSNVITTTTIAIAPTSTNALISLGGSLGLILLVVAILEVVQDFEKGLKMKYKALMFNIGAIIGLYVFWNSISNLTPKTIGSNAIFSSILSIVIVFIGMGLAIYLEWRAI